MFRKNKAEYSYGNSWAKVKLLHWSKSTLRVWMRSLIVFRGSDIAARTTGVWRSSDIEVKKSSWNSLMQLAVAGGLTFFQVASSSSPRTFSQSYNDCKQWKTMSKTRQTIWCNKQNNSDTKIKQKEKKSAGRRIQYVSQTLGITNGNLCETTQYRSCKHCWNRLTTLL